jgi:Rps23 Pro-64 3,4-dihydroxylase Tpa1-like proline 4-hydroxylase
VLDARQLSEYVAEKILDSSASLTDQWHNPSGTNTRHLVLDDLLPEEIALDISKAFPQDEKIWHQVDSFRERKKTFAKLERINPLIAHITDAFHQENVLGAVRSITNLDGLEPDPELYAGGISMMGHGDFLNPHIDNSHDADRGRYRRLNLLYYIAPNWLLDNGGNFELWDSKVIHPTTIVSRFNRLVVMETNRTSWHSVTKVTANAARSCISNYYFSKNSPDGEDYYHITAFLGRPGQTWRRGYGRVDNFLRQFIAANLKISRGKRLARHE